MHRHTNARFLTASCLIFLATALVASAALPVPPKTVVLTFDDSDKSYRTFVAPLLKELGMGATFFVSHRWMDDRTNYMTWDEIGELHQMGFEVGNHTWTHDDFSQPKSAARLAGETSLIDRELNQSKAKVPRPVSFAYPGNFFGAEAVQRLTDLGYRFARRGEMPEARVNTRAFGSTYDPKQHHPLLIPTTGDVYLWTLDGFKQVVTKATAGQVVVLQFHGAILRGHPFVKTPPGFFRECMTYLKENKFQCLALRDLEPFIDRARLADDPMLKTRHPPRAEDKLVWPVEMTASRTDARSWLENMIGHHHFTLDEAAQVLGWKQDEVKARVAEYKIEPSDPQAPTRDAAGRTIRVLPYPGGRHPRIGFLDGAIDPQRGTKLSLFPPWKDGGYVVLDLPEAIFSNLGLTYLAHTHIPTIWNQRSVVIENVDWTRTAQGGLRSEWRLPNGIAFGAQVVPLVDGADLELWLTNGTPAHLKDLRTQICLMLKASQGFNEQNQERKEYAKPMAVVSSKDGNRSMLLAFERCGRAWGNAPCPCVHSDPVLPEAAPGQRVTVRGRLLFYEGTDLAGAKRRLVEGLDGPGKPGRR